jgi:hypothetical protein
LTFNQLQIASKKVTKDLPSKFIHIQKNSEVRFLIYGFPKLLPPSNLAISAYSENNGTAVRLLKSTNSDNATVRLNLPEGTYILLATATWLPRSEDVTGYAAYKFLIDVS